MSRCAKCGESEYHVVHSHRHSPPYCDFDAAVPAKAVIPILKRFIRYFESTSAREAWGPLVEDAKALLRDAGAEPNAIRRGGE